MRSSASPPSTKRHSESRHSTDDDDVDDDVEDEEDVDVEQCSDCEDLKDSSEPPSKKVIIINKNLQVTFIVINGFLNNSQALLSP